MSHIIKNEIEVEYKTDPINIENEIIENALLILKNRMFTAETYITSPNDTKNFLKLKLSQLEHEIFCVIYLNNKHAVIAYEELFKGTIDSASVYPREILKNVLAHNAKTIILAHNHPSGSTDPSTADIEITNRLKEALSYIDVKILDHIIIGGNKSLSFAEEGLL